MIRFEIDLPAQPWQRARKSGKVHFTASDMKAYQDLVRVLCLVEMRRQGIYRPLEGPLHMEVECYAGRAVVTITPLDGPKWKTTRPDADNLFKNIADALNKTAYKDDAQIASLSVIKVVTP